MTLYFSYTFHHQMFDNFQYRMFHVTIQMLFTNLTVCVCVCVLLFILAGECTVKSVSENTHGTQTLVQQARLLSLI